MPDTVTEKNDQYPVPQILAPAGNNASFLAALAAGADAVYCGLKAFSARMTSDNFQMEELVKLTHLAHEKGAKVYVAVNTLVKTTELASMAEMLYQLRHTVKPDGIIFQDMAVLQLARQMNFQGEMHLSTLANLTLMQALPFSQKTLRIDRVVLPRELNIDEIKSMAEACPKGLGLEIFVHGALCYGVSGRCYWSSYLGGKSGLRGRCVQPCRRRYAHKGGNERFFSCMDLSLDVLVKVLSVIPEIKAWKIEGRKKGPHYVYYTTRAYRLMRDKGSDPQSKKEALELLGYVLGRPATHYFFLPQRPQNPVKSESHTGSGLLIGNIKGGKQQPYLVPREQLFDGDLLRVGYEDEKWHALVKVNKWVPKNGRLVIKKQPDHKIMGGVPVFLIDRREPELDKHIKNLQKELDLVTLPKPKIGQFKFTEIKPTFVKSRYKEMKVFRNVMKTIPSGRVGFWINGQMPKPVSKKNFTHFWWWLPPVIWPEEENQFKSILKQIIDQGGKYFVLNAPWQTSLFPLPKKLNLWAGPFCNAANPFALMAIKKMGFKGAIVSPELGGDDLLQLPSKSPIELGIVCFGSWPLCISRTVSEDLEIGTVFSSPKGEEAWVQKYGKNFWVYPNWKLDIRNLKEKLIQAGFSFFISISEPIPKGIILKKRPGQWNWNIGLA
jgi:U32 family peptidase